MFEVERIETKQQLMNFPIYNSAILHAITCEIGENVEFHEFDAFCRELVYQNLSACEEEDRVLSCVLANGTYALNSTDSDILSSIVDRFDKPCKECGHEFPLQHRIFLSEQEDLCNFHFCRKSSTTL